MNPGTTDKTVGDKNTIIAISGTILKLTIVQVDAYLGMLVVQSLSECLVVKYLEEGVEAQETYLIHLDFVRVTFVPLHLPNHHLLRRAVNFQLTRFGLD